MVLCQWASFFQYVAEVEDPYNVGRRATGLVSNTTDVESLVTLEEGVTLGGDGGHSGTLGVLGAGNTGINGASRREGGDDDGGTHFDDDDGYQDK